MDKLIKRINERIRERGMKLVVVAERSNISCDLLGRTLVGKRRLKADEFVALCRVLELTLSDFRNSAAIAESGERDSA
ncbi:hypothetical protein FACS18949_07700 [Clostridia bacterium]|nr:hypothetical protein FACS18949_07700 [Clostridia bacterium]